MMEQIGEQKGKEAGRRLGAHQPAGRWRGAQIGAGGWRHGVLSVSTSSEEDDESERGKK